MTVTLQRPEQKRTTWQRMRLWGLAHAVDDLYQGLVPTTVPYFVLERHDRYVAASGVTLAAMLGSSLPQPFFGVVADRLRAGWMAGAGGRARRARAEPGRRVPGLCRDVVHDPAVRAGCGHVPSGGGQGRPAGRGR